MQGERGEGSSSYDREKRKEREREKEREGERGGGENDTLLLFKHTYRYTPQKLMRMAIIQTARTPP